MDSRGKREQDKRLRCARFGTLLPGKLLLPSSDGSWSHDLDRTFSYSKTDYRLNRADFTRTCTRLRAQGAQSPRTETQKTDDDSEGAGVTKSATANGPVTRPQTRTPAFVCCERMTHLSNLPGVLTSKKPSRHENDHSADLYLDVAPKKPV